MTSNIVMPKIEREAVSRNYGRFVISPLERGYGITMGNALRRIMISSLSGAAVTSVRVVGVHHEFSPIPNVKEDMMQLILHLKQLRVELFGETEKVRLHLDVQGGVVTAADLICPPEVEIKNLDQYLFTIDDDSTRVEMELTVELGRGYSPAEERGRLPIGEIPVDAIYSPIRRVNFDIEPARVEQKTNFDKLIFEVWTDGTVQPEYGMSEAAKILMQQLSIIANVDPEMFTVSPEPVAPEEPQRPDYYDLPIEGLDLSVRVFNSLKRTGITTVGEVLELLDKGEDAMLAIRNFGDKSLTELVDKLAEKDYVETESYITPE